MARAGTGKGRPSRYTSCVLVHFEEIRGWTRDGIPEEEQAKRLGIAYSSWCNYKRAYPEFRELLSHTKDLVDSQMVGATYKRALGYTVLTHEKEYQYIYDKAGKLVERRLVKEREKEVHVPGEPSLQMYWLRHRRKDEWGEVVSEQTGEADQKSGIVLLPARIEEKDGEGSVDATTEAT